MTKLKEIWGWIVAFVVGAAGLFLYFFSRRGDKINELQAKINLSETTKQSDALESEIKKAQSNKDNLKKEQQELDRLMKENETKRAENKKKAEDLTDPNEIADYWNKQ